MKNIDKKLDEVLKQEFDFNLPDDFTDKVLVKIKNTEVKSDRNMYWWITGLSVLLIVAAIGTLIYSGSITVFKPLAEYGMWLAIGAGLVTVIQILDQKLVKGKMKTV